MSEARLWSKLRKNLNLGFGELDRVENMVLAGMSDVNFCFNGVEGWIELKYREKPPARSNTRVFGRKGLNKDQVSWISTRVSQGGRVFIMSQAGRYIFLHNGSIAQEFNELCMDQLHQLALWKHPDNNWKSLKDALRGKKP